MRGRPPAGRAGVLPALRPPATMTGAMVVRRGGRAEAFGAAGVLALAAVLAATAPLLGAVRAADGSAVWFAPGALWVGLLPALLVAVAAVRRPVVALAVAAGSGVVGAARLLADLPIVTATDSIARPDLFVETTDRSLPLHASGGAYLLLAADTVTLLVGVVAAFQLAGRLSLSSGPDPAGDRAGGPTGDAAADDVVADAVAVDRAVPDVVVTDAVVVDAVVVDVVTDAAAYQSEREAVRDRAAGRNYLLTTAGFLGVLLLAIAALMVPYQGGYLADRYLAVGVPLLGLVGAVLLAVLAATAVLVSGPLPRGIAVGLLGGVAVGACLPYLIALATVVSAPVHLTSAVWLGLSGGCLLVVAGLLARTRLVTAREPLGTDETIAAPSRAAAIAAGWCGIGAAALCAAALVLPPLDAGGLENLLALSDGSPIPGATLFGAAVIPLAVAGALALWPRTARAGRAALMVVWAGVVPAVTAALQVLGDDGISTARMLGLVRIGSGTWCGIAGLVLAGVAAVLAAVTSRRVASASAAIADDDSVATARAVTIPIALGLSVLTAIAAVWPAYGTSGLIQGPSVLHGYDVSAWGVWTGLVVTVAALAGAAVTRHRGVAVALSLSAAAVQAVRLVVPAGVAQAPGFGLRPGLVVVAVLVVALVVASGVLARAVGRVREVDLAGPVAAAARGGASSRVSRRRKR